jgi:hypothetical protein
MDLGIFYMGTCRGKDAKHSVSAGKIVPTIGKCIGIMGGRMQFAPTIILKILLILIQKPAVRTPKPRKNDASNIREIQ